MQYIPTEELKTLIPSDQFFCENSIATLADIRLNHSDVLWYDAPSNGSQLPLTTLLQNNVTYYVIKQTMISCPRIIRLPVKVVLGQIPAPNLPAPQSFCSTQNATVQDLFSNGYDIIWKDAGGNVLLNTQPLINNQVYYAYAKATADCISISATAVTVQINQPAISTEIVELKACSSLADINALLNINNSDWFYDENKTNSLPTNAALQNNAIYYSTAINQATCEVINYKVTVKIIPQAVTLINLDASASYCTNQEYTFNATKGFTVYNWQVNDATIIAGGSTTDSFITVKWTTIGNKTLLVDVDTLACLATNQAQQNINIPDCSTLNSPDPDMQITIVADNETPYYLDETTFKVTITNLTNQEFKNVEINAALNSGFAYVSHTATSGSYNRSQWQIATVNANESVTLTLVAKVLEQGSHEQRVAITASLPVDAILPNNEAAVTLNPLKNNCLIVYNEVSPNQDGLNDYFTISCIQNYPQTKLEIYNRYGNLVYRNNNYDNSFNGQANVSGTFGSNDLPTGTYFYTLQFSDGITQKKSGWLYIMR